MGERAEGIVSAVRAARHLHMGKDKLRRLTTAGLIPCITDPETGEVKYSIRSLDRWQDRLGELAAEAQHGRVA